MNFLEALKSGKRFRPKGSRNPLVWCDLDHDQDFIVYKMKNGGEPPISWSTPTVILGEWEVEETACEHEPKCEHEPERHGHAGITSFGMPCFPLFMLRCVHCKKDLEPVGGWREKK